ncbi:unnamed protein product, partial [Pylaiella littoralis]
PNFYQVFPLRESRAIHVLCSPEDPRSTVCKPVGSGEEPRTSDGRSLIYFLEDENALKQQSSSSSENTLTSLLCTLSSHLYRAARVRQNSLLTMRLLGYRRCATAVFLFSVLLWSLLLPPSGTFTWHWARIGPIYEYLQQQAKQPPQCL